MRITVFGSTGELGMRFVEQAVAAGHKLRCLVRTVPKSVDPSVEYITGDLLTPTDVEASLSEAEAVFVTLGGGKEIKSKICSQAQPVINQAILRHSNPNMRVVVITSLGVGDSYHTISWGTRKFVDWVIYPAIADKNLQERAVIRDLSNWVIVRPGGLGSGPLTKVYNVGCDLPGGMGQVARADVAHFVLTKCFDDSSEWKRLPVSVTK